MYKRLLLAILFTVLTLELSVLAYADETTLQGTCGSSATWTLSENGTLEISGSGKVVPDNFNEYKNHIKKVIINEGIEEIGDRCFYQYNEIEEISMPSSLKKIDDYAFAQCSNWAGNLNIPNGVETIGEYAFVMCKSLTGDLTIPNSVTSVGQHAFRECSGFDGSLTISNKMTSIQPATFEQCYKLTGTIIIPTSIKNIYGSAFSGCSSFTGNLNIPGNVEYVYACAFINCNGITGDINIEEGVKGFKESGLSGSALPTLVEGTVTIPSTFEIDETNTIYSLHKINKVINKSSVQINLPYLENDKWVKEGNTNFEISSIKNGTAIRKRADAENPEGETTLQGTCGSSATWTLSENGTLEISGSGKVVPDNFNEYKNHIKKVIINEGIEEIGDRCFYQYNEIEEISMPSSLKKIDDYAFAQCSNWAGNLNIPNGVETIGEYAFVMCKSLTGDLTIPNSVTSVGQHAFRECSGFDGSLTISNKMTSIQPATFEQCYKLTGTIIIPTSIKNIYGSAFSGCSSFTGNLNIPGNVEYVYACAFINCNGITGDINIEEGVKGFKESGLSGSALPTLVEGTVTIPSTFEIDETNTIYSLHKINKVINKSSVQINLPYLENDKWVKEGNTNFEISSIKNGTAIRKCYIRKYDNTILLGSEYVIYGNKIVLPTEYSKTGYKIEGWYKSAIQQNDVTRWDFLNDVVSKSVDLYLKWEPNEYTVTFNANGGSCSTSSITVKYDNNYGTLPTPTKTGFDFLGWYTQLEGGTKVNYNSKYTVDDDSALFAHWQASTFKTTLKYDLNGGSGLLPDQEIDATYPNTRKEFQISSVEPSKCGYLFAGWYTNKIAGTIVENTFTVGDDYIADNQFATIYAHWDIVTYSISYNLNGGTNGDNPDVYTVETENIVLNEPTKEGYVFDGWYYGNQKITQISKGTIGDILLTAKWKSPSEPESGGTTSDNNSGEHGNSGNNDNTNSGTSSNEGKQPESIPTYVAPEKKTIVEIERTNIDGITTNLEVHIDGTVRETSTISTTTAIELSKLPINLETPTVISNVKVIVDKSNVLSAFSVEKVTLSVDVKTIGGNINIIPEMVDVLKKEAVSKVGKKDAKAIDIKVNTTAADGKPVSFVVSSDDLKNNSSLYAYIIDPVTGKYIIADVPAIKYDKNTGLTINNLVGGYNYVFVLKKESQSIEKSILDSIKLLPEFSNTINVRPGTVIDLTKVLQPGLNILNVSKVEYSVNGNKGVIDPTTGLLYINNESKGTITANIKITLKNGQSKTIKVKIKS